MCVCVGEGEGGYFENKGELWLKALNIYESSVAHATHVRTHTVLLSHIGKLTSVVGLIKLQYLVYFMYIYDMEYCRIWNKKQ